MASIRKLKKAIREFAKSGIEEDALESMEMSNLMDGSGEFGSMFYDGCTDEIENGARPFAQRYNVSVHDIIHPPSMLHELDFKHPHYKELIKQNPSIIYNIF